MPLDFVLPLGALLIAASAAFAVSALIGILLGRVSAPEPPGRSGTATPSRRFEG